MNKFKYILALAVLAAPLLARPVYADDTSLYLAPGSGNFSQGSTLTLQIRENSGNQSVNAVQANLNYNPNMLDFVGFVDSPAFVIDAENFGADGVVRVARGAFAPVTGDQLVASVEFVAKDSGSTSISFTNRSAVVSSATYTDVLNGGGLGGTYQIQATQPDVVTTPTAVTTPNSQSQTKIVTSTDSPATETTPIVTSPSQDIDLANLLTGLNDYANHVL